MRILLFNHLRNAHEAIRSNRMRSILTVLGVTLGIACITSIMSLSHGVSSIVNDQVQQLEGNISVVRPGTLKEDRSIEQIISDLTSQSFTATVFTERDYKAIKDVEGIEAIAPLMAVGGSVSSNEEQLDNVPIVATTPDLAEISDFEIAEGGFIDSVANLNTAVLGNQASIDLFGTDLSIGKTLTVKGQRYTVIGVLRDIKNPIHYNNFDANRSVFVSLDAGKSFNQDIAQIQQINIQAADKESLKEVNERVFEAMHDSRQGEEDFSILTGETIAEPTDDLFTLIRGTAYAISAISLLIGGIGIMNIMLVGVAERTREIGIRKTVGASNYHITLQFLIESLAMSTLGGIFGIILGFVGAFVISLIIPVVPGFDWNILLIAFGISAGIGTLFGLYPAIRAARKNPIEALRQYI